MSMKVNFNMSAVLANDYLRKTDNAVTKSMRRLSSGFKINDAGDSPSGIAIGRRMRAQIKSISEASQNATEAVAVMQIAEGALNEVHDMLQRMNELSIKAANGTLSGDGSIREGGTDMFGNPNGAILSTSDRDMIQQEIDQLLAEIERVAATTEYNGRKLLDGTFDTKGHLEATRANNPDSTIDADGLELLRSAVTVKSYSDDTPLGMYIVDVQFNKYATYNYTPAEPDDPDSKKYKLEIDEKGITIGSVSIGSDEKGYSYHGQTIAYNTVQGVENFFNDDSSEITLKNDSGFELKLQVDWDKLTTVDADGKRGFNADLNGKFAIVPNADDPMFQLDILFGDIEIVDSDKDNSKFQEELKNLVKDYLEPKDPTAPDYAAKMAEYEEKYKLEDGVSGDFNDRNATDSYYSSKEKRVSAAISAVQEAMLKKSSFGATTNLTGKGVMTEQIGASEGAALDIRIPRLSNKDLGIDGLDVSSQDKARNSITRVSKAIDELSMMRSRLGAYQNRLEHTIVSLDASEESVTEALSRIMDTDMAEEMSFYSQQQILSQAGTSILAQANQRPSQILQLLQ